MGEMKNLYRIVVLIPEGKRVAFEDSGVGGRMGLKCILRK
jgi:hypothetical protein